MALLKTTVLARNKAVMFERTIPIFTIHKAIAVTFFAALLTTFGTLFILIHDNFPFVQTLFEVISAFNTVGLSMGITSQLSDFAKVVMIIMMYLGRIGPISFVVALAKKEKEEVFEEECKQDEATYKYKQWRRASSWCSLPRNWLRSGSGGAPPPPRSLPIPGASAPPHGTTGRGRA